MTPDGASQTAQTLADFIMTHKVSGTETAASFVAGTVSGLVAVEPGEAEPLSAISAPTDPVLVVQVIGNFIANHSMPPVGTPPGQTVLVELVYDVASSKTLSVRYFEAPPAGASGPALTGAAATTTDPLARAVDAAGLDRLGVPQPLALTTP